MPFTACILALVLLGMCTLITRQYHLCQQGSHCAWDVCLVACEYLCIVGRTIMTAGMGPSLHSVPAGEMMFMSSSSAA